MQPTVNECVLRRAAGADLSAQYDTRHGWCPAQTEDLGGNASYTFQVSQSTPLAFNSNGQVVNERAIVSTGNGQRRPAACQHAGDGARRDPLFPKGYRRREPQLGLVRQQRLITGNLGSNGNITLNEHREGDRETPSPASARP